jgi:hypothetical protein
MTGIHMKLYHVLSILVNVSKPTVWHLESFLFLIHCLLICYLNSIYGCSICIVSTLLQIAFCIQLYWAFHAHQHSTSFINHL